MTAVHWTSMILATLHSVIFWWTLDWAYRVDPGHSRQGMMDAGEAFVFALFAVFLMSAIWLGFCLVNYLALKAITK